MLLIVFCMYITVKRRTEASRSVIKREYLEKVDNKWNRYLLNEEDKPIDKELIPKDRYEVQVVENLFLSYLENVNSLTMQEKIVAFSNEYLEVYYRKHLNSPKWSTRMNALYRIYDFQLHTLLDDCRDLENEKASKEERFQLLKIYSRLSNEHFLSTLLSKSINFSEHEYKQLLNKVPNENVERLMERFDELQEFCKYALIDMLGQKRNIDYLPFLESLLLNTNSEVRVKSLKAVYEIGWINTPEMYIHFVYSTIWEERFMVAKLMGLLPLGDTISYFQILLQDTSWRVYTEAAKSIATAYGKSGKDMLLEFKGQINDRDVISRINEVLERGV